MTRVIFGKVRAVRPFAAKVGSRAFGKVRTGWSALHGDREAQLELLAAFHIRHPVIAVNDYRMKLDLDDKFISRWLFLYGPWEPQETKLMKRLLRPGAVFVDVGAHIGYYTLLAARTLGHKGRVFAFEPSPDNFSLLLENVRINRCTELVTAESIALCNNDLGVELHLSDVNTGDHRIYPTNKADDEIFNQGTTRQRTVRVPSVRLDDYLRVRMIEEIDAMKVDVQGAEMSVILGAADTLRRSSHLILFMEFWPHGLLSCNTEPEALLDFLSQDLGLCLYQIDAKGLIPLEPSEFAARTRSVDPQVQIDLVACRGPQPL